MSCKTLGRSYVWSPGRAQARVKFGENVVDFRSCRRALSQRERGEKSGEKRKEKGEKERRGGKGKKRGEKERRGGKRKEEGGKGEEEKKKEISKPSCWLQHMPSQCFFLFLRHSSVFFPTSRVFFPTSRVACVIPSTGLPYAARPPSKKNHQSTSL